MLNSCVQVIMAKTNFKDEVQTKSKQCRVCLGSRGLIPIFGDENHPDISIELMIFGTVEVHRDDDFPQLLCKECFLLLDGAVSFRKNATRSDGILKSRIKEINSNNVFFLVKTEEDISPLKNYEEWPRIFIDQGYLKRNTTADEDTAPMLKKEVVDNDEMNNEDESITVIAKKERKECVKCNQIFHSVDDLDQHEPTCGKKSIVSLIQPTNKEKIKSELRRRSRVQNVKCEICKMTFSQNMYPKHMRQAHDTTIKKQECPICKKMFCPEYVNVHIKFVHSGYRKPKGKVECPVCKKVFAERYYKVHIKTHNSGKGDYICDVCGKDFLFNGAFMKHRTTHNNDFPCKCDYCPYRGRNKDLLRIHTRTHTGDYPYKCDNCNARYTTKSNLNKHMQRHRGAIDFLCDSCNRGFYTKLELERHISAIHLGIKNHLCNLCGAAFGYKKGLMNHMRRVHKKNTGKGGRMALYLKLQSEKVLQ